MDTLKGLGNQGRVGKLQFTNYKRRFRNSQFEQDRTDIGELSGICGIVSFDERSPARAELMPMVSSLERRGPDDTDTWHNGSVALGHSLLATTPEALTEKLPLTHTETGCTITADARLDNRETLLAALGVEQTGPVIGDGELILRSYLRWGHACPDRLHGDFAFAIWDPRQATLFCARDQMGMRQLCYARGDDGSFVFGTQPDTIAALLQVATKLDNARIADFLLDREWYDLTSTFHENIKRLPPGHTLAAQNGSLQVRRYWHLEEPAELQLADDQEYAAAFREVFERAVTRRLRSNGRVASTLSGGLNSGSVAATAARCLRSAGQTPLLTISGVGPDFGELPRNTSRKALCVDARL